MRLSLLRDGTVLFHRHTADEWAKWLDTLSVVRDNKLLRNALVGCSLGRSGGTPFWHNGERKLARGRHGHLRAAGLLVVRSAYELCRIAAEQTDAFYANIDSVICNECAFPHIWESVGLTVREQANGHAHICGRGIYEIGGKQTKWYSLGSRFALPEPRSPLPERLFYRQWI
jgi:hypothetical protein